MVSIAKQLYARTSEVAMRGLCHFMANIMLMTGIVVSGLSAAFGQALDRVDVCASRWWVFWSGVGRVSG